MPSHHSFNFLSFDIYSKRITFFYENQEKISSYFGLILTLTYIIASLILFIYYFAITIQRKEMTVYESTIYSENTPSLDVNSSLIYFAFGIEDKTSRFIDETIYYPKILYIHRVKKNGIFQTQFSQELPYERCKEENFGEQYQKFFYKGELNTSYCLQNYNITLEGGFKYDKMSYIRLKIFPCINTTENNNHCKPREVIEQYFSGAYFSLIIKDIGLNPSNFLNPVTSTIQDLYTTIDKKFFRDFVLYFGLTEIHSDIGLFSENLQKNHYLRYRKQMQTFYLRNESEIYNGKEVCVLQIRLDDSINIQKRTYTKLPEIFSRIGGYMQLISTVFSIISLFINKIGPEIKILNGIFNFNLEKNKMMMKIRSLKDFNINILTRKSKNNISFPQRMIQNLKCNNIHNSNRNNNKEIINNDSILPITVVNNKQSDLSHSHIFENKLNNTKQYEDLKLSVIKHNVKKKKESRLSGSFRKSLNDKEDKFIENQKIKYTLHFNIFDYYCLRKLNSKKKLIELFQKGSSLYRRRMDIINVFTLLLLSEQKLLTYDKKK